MQNFTQKYFSNIIGYRYSYNGMEKDNEVSGSGNSYTTQFRQYDPRLGRWKSLDPLAGKFPDESPFSAFGNNPVYYLDPLGLASQGAGDGSKGGNKQRKSGEHRRNENKANRAAKKYAREHGIDKNEYKVVMSESTGNWWMDYEIEGGVGTHKVLDAKANSDSKKKEADVKAIAIEISKRPKDIIYDPTNGAGTTDLIDQSKKEIFENGGVKMPVTSTDNVIFMENGIPLQIEPMDYGNLADWGECGLGYREVELDGILYKYDDDGNLSTKEIIPIGGAGGLEWVVGPVKVAATPKLLNQYNNVESLIQYSKFTRLKGGVQQAIVVGDGATIFKTITQNAVKQTNGTYLLSDGTILTSHVSKVTGAFTIDINKAGTVYKIRFTQ